VSLTQPVNLPHGRFAAFALAAVKLCHSNQQLRAKTSSIDSGNQLGRLSNKIDMHCGIS
jgi:hypothetical protein